MKKKVSKRKKSSLFAILGVTSMLALTACGQSTGTSKDSSKPFAGKTIKVILMSGTYSDAAKLIESEFEKETGAKAEIVDAPYLQLYPKEFSALTTGAGDYDVMSVAMQWDGTFVNYMYPIPQNSGIDFSKFIPAIAKVTGEYNGVRFGVPMADDAYGVFYRKDLFQKAGITADPHWTWAQYEADAHKLTANGIYGTSITGQLDQMSGQVLPRYWANGGHLFTPDWNPIPQKDLLVKSIQDVINLMKTTMPKGMMSYDIPAQSNAFIQGKVAMAEVWPSFTRGLSNDASKSKVTNTWGLLPYPSGGHSQISSWDLGVPKSSKNKELALKWIQLYTSEQSQRLFLNKIGIGPTISSIYTDPQVVKEHPDFPNQLLGLQGAQPPLRFAGAQQYTDELDRQINAALTGSVTPEQAVNNVIQKWNDLLQQNGKPDGKYNGD